MEGISFARRGLVVACALATLAALIGCGVDDGGSPSDETAPTEAPATEAPTSDPTDLIQPEDLEYAGAFRLPDGEDSEARTWDWADGSITYRADGDAGSLLGIGHAQQFMVSEIAIPEPVVSPGKDIADLPIAETIQGFEHVFPEDVRQLEIPIGGLAYLPPQDGQGAAKLHLVWGQWLQYELVPSRGWCELDLAEPDTAGSWYLGDLDVRGSCDYVCEVPEEWAAAFAPGLRLASGRFKDGGQASQGPTLHAYAPWESGDPPADGTVLPYTTLLAYDVVGQGSATLAGYEHSDEWLGAVWMTAGDAGAVVLAGTKGISEGRETWYGFADGGDGEAEPPTDLPDNEKGWWSDRFEGQLLFYDPAELAAVALGDAEPSSPQPYAVVDVDDLLFAVTHEQQKEHVVGAAFDGEGGRLFLVEPFADGDRPIVHVWEMREE